MKILIVTGSMDSGGAETHVLELARSLARLENQITVVSSGGGLAEGLCREGILHLCMQTNSRNPVTVLKIRTRLKKLLCEQKFHIVHAHTRLCAFVMSDICQGLNIPLVTTIHAHYKKGSVFNLLSRWGNGTVAVSQDLAFHLTCLTSAVLPENIRVIQNGIDTGRFCPSNEETKDKKVIFASRLDRDCSDTAYLLLSVAEALYEKFPDLKIVICGGGEEYASIKKKAEEINIRVGRKIVLAEGYADNMEKMLKGAFVFVGVSRAALEAMSVGIPVLLSGNEGYIGEVTEENLQLCEQSNFCCRGEKRANKEMLLGELDKMLSKTNEEYQKTSHFLREYILKTHSSESMAKQTLEFYKKYIKRQNIKKNQLLLCGYYGFGNMGDDAQLLRSIEYTNKKYPHLFPCALTKEPQKNAQKFGIKCVNRKNIFKVKKQIRNSRAVVFGGGTLLQNSTSRRSLLYYLYILNYAYKKGKRIELWGNGIGYIKGKWFRRKTAVILGKCSYIGIRDKNSFAEIVRLLRFYKITAPPMALESDLAARPFYTQKGKYEYLKNLYKIPDKKRKAVIILNGNQENKSIEHHLKKLSGDGVFLAFAVMYPREDMRVSEKMCKKVGGIIVHPIGIAELTELMRNAFLVISSRYHGLVFSCAAGTSFIGFGESEKVQGFCHEYGGKYLDKREIGDVYF